ncbi:MAG: lasso peptide biosynthesis B2 protein [Proteobacteria bacterium]|nr:lasso peptide biosynthesis B2 protein [Pseudomonadota bacterium]
MKQILKFFRVPPTDRYLLVKSTFLLGVIRLGLSLLPLKRLLGLVGSVKHELTEVSSAGNNISSNQIVWAVEVASRYVPFATCLTRALVVQMLFAREGYPAHLCIGVAKSKDDRLEAHAWVESEGRIVTGDLKDISRFNLLPQFEGERL